MSAVRSPVISPRSRHCDPKTFPRVTSRIGFEDQIVAHDPQRFQIGRASSSLPLLLEPPFFFCGPCALGGSILSLGHKRSEANPLWLGKSSHRAGTADRSRRHCQMARLAQVVHLCPER
jgi:hypothetical protein